MEFVVSGAAIHQIALDAIRNQGYSAVPRPKPSRSDGGGARSGTTASFTPHNCRLALDVFRDGPGVGEGRHGHWISEITISRTTSGAT